MSNIADSQHFVTYIRRHVTRFFAVGLSERSTNSIWRTTGECKQSPAPRDDVFFRSARQLVPARKMFKPRNRRKL